MDGIFDILCEDIFYVIFSVADKKTRTNLFSTCNTLYKSNINIKVLSSEYIEYLKNNGMVGIRGNYSYEYDKLHLYQCMDRKFKIVSDELLELHINGNFGYNYNILNPVFIPNLEILNIKIMWYSHKLNPDKLMKCINEMKKIKQIKISFYNKCQKNNIYDHTYQFVYLLKLFERNPDFVIGATQLNNIIQYNDNCCRCGGFCHKLRHKMKEFSFMYFSALKY